MARWNAPREHLMEQQQQASRALAPLRLVGLEASGGVGEEVGIGEVRRWEEEGEE